MAGNSDLHNANVAKKDEFYTQYDVIEAEVNAYLEYNPDTFRGKTVLLPCDDPEWSNFTRFFAQKFEALGLKKLISTSYAAKRKKKKYGDESIEKYHQITIFELNSPQYDAEKSPTHGKIFTLSRDDVKKKIDLDDLQWSYLEGDGDYNSDEVKKLRDEADIIVTNPPFSKFRNFISWAMPEEKSILILGNQNAITYKEIFPLIMNNKIWLGPSIHSGDREFRVPDDYPLNAASSRIDDEGNRFIRVKGVRWFTNLEHGRRHNPLSLMSTEDNIKFSKHKEVKGIGYKKYENYDAIEIPYSDAIPSDYKGVMGVPITFLDKYCPEQFEILGMCENLDLYGLKTKVYSSEECRQRYFELFGKKGTYDLNASGVVDGYKVYQRILIRSK